MMRRTRIVLLLSLTGLLGPLPLIAAPPPSTPPAPQDAQGHRDHVAGELAATDPASRAQDAIENVRATFEQPAIVAVVVRNGEIIFRGAAGERTLRQPGAVTLDDRFHLGHCAKSMTATLAGILIQQGELRWETTLGDVFGDLFANADSGSTLHDGYSDVTIEHLLSHRGGMPDFLELDQEQWNLLRSLTGTGRDQRRELTRHLLVQPPAHTPAEAMQYSNAGYAVAAAMLEAVMDASWRDLMRDHVFEPLGMETAGFGWPLNEARPEAPAGHIAGPERLLALDLRMHQMYALPLALEPTGDVHASIEDFGRYLAFYQRALQGNEERLSKEAAENLIRIRMNFYALGWAVRPELFGGPAVGHSGSAATFYAMMHHWPLDNLAVAVITNAGNGSPACMELTERLRHIFLDTATAPADGDTPVSDDDGA